MRIGTSIALSQRQLIANASSWTPAELTGLVLWLDAADASTITLNGSTVSQWDDKSGNSRHATQATAANQPTYTAAGLNSRNVVTHSPSDFLIIPDVYFPYQSAFVLYSDTSTTNYTTALGGRYNVNSPYHGDVTATKLFSTQYTSPETLNGSNFANGVSIGNGQTTPRPATPTIFSFIATSQFDTNRRLQTIGTDASIRDSRTINGLIAEVVILETAASTADRQKLEGYLAWKWGLAENLPPDHPYRVDGSLFGYGSFTALSPSGSDLLVTSDGDVFIVQ